MTRQFFRQKGVFRTLRKPFPLLEKHKVIQHAMQARALTLGDVALQLGEINESRQVCRIESNSVEKDCAHPLGVDYLNTTRTFSILALYSI